MGLKGGSGWGEGGRSGGGIRPTCDRPVTLVSRRTKERRWRCARDDLGVGGGGVGRGVGRVVGRVVGRGVGRVVGRGV